jgi:hypothetical protein
MSRKLGYMMSEDAFAAENARCRIVSSTAPDSDNLAITFGVMLNTAFSVSSTATTVGPAYMFTAPLSEYRRIFSEQCNRVSAFIYEHFEQLNRHDDDCNEKIIERVASAIDLVGEPAFGAAYLEASVLRKDKFALEQLLFAVATAKGKETEAGRLEMLRGYVESSDPSTRRAAVRALGRMESQDAKALLRKIGSPPAHGEIAQLAAALSK